MSTRPPLAGTAAAFCTWPQAFVNQFAKCGISRVVSTDRKSTRLNSSHLVISYAVFCLKKKKVAVHLLRLISPAVGRNDDPKQVSHAALLHEQTRVQVGPGGLRLRPSDHACDRSEKPGQ